LDLKLNIGYDRVAGHFGPKTVVLTLCGLSSQKTHQGGLGLGGSVHEEAHPRFPYLIQTSFGLTGSDCPNRLDTQTKLERERAKKMGLFLD